MSNSDRLFGLLAFHAYSKNQIPLKEINVHALINNFIADVSCKYIFENCFDEFLDADFVFPLMSSSTVYRFEAIIGNQIFISVCRDRIEAESTYQTAVTNDQTAFILNEDETMGDVFTMRIGNIPPKSSVHLTISYFDQLDTRSADSMDTQRGESLIGSLAIFTLPALLNQRYQPKDIQIERQFSPSSTFPITRGNASYNFSFTADICCSTPLLDVTSTHHKFVLDPKSEDNTLTKVRLTSNLDFTCDLEMELTFADRHELALSYEPGSQSASCSSILGMDCLTANFLPILQDCQCENCEIIFLIDRSGSMEGSNIAQAKQSLLILLKSLPTNCRFQVIGFGSTHEALFSEPLDYTEENLHMALEYQKNLEADMGGTNVLSVLRAVYNPCTTGQGWSQQIIFLTDGDVFNQTEIISLVKQESLRTNGRLFPIGLGEGASTALVAGMARAGRGKAIFVRSNKGSSLQEAVMGVLHLALQHPAEEVRLEWSVSVEGEPTTVLTIPKHLGPIFSDNYFAAIGLISNPNHKPVEGKAQLYFKVNGELNFYEATFSSLTHSSSIQSLCFHRQAAKLQIVELTDEYSALQACGKSGTRDETDALRRLQTEIIQLSMATNVLSRFTAFVGFNPQRQEHMERRSISIPRRVPQMACDGVDNVDCCQIVSRSRLLGGPLSSVVCERSKEEENDVVVALAGAQLYSGAWTASEDLARIIGFSIDKLNSSASFCGTDLERTVWSTCYVIAFLERKLSSRRTEWRLMSKKANKWLLETLNSSQDVLNQCLSAAFNLIDNSLLE